MDADDPSYLTLNQMAQAAGLPAKWLREQADAGRIPFLRVGRLMKFNRAQTFHALEKLAEASAAEEVAHG